MSNSISPMSRLIDKHGRKASYARISITDRCNLNCIYCGNSRRKTFIPHKHILRYEELIRLAHILDSMGIGKIRITGGEPLMRKNCVAFLGHLRKNFPAMRLCLTTNGTLLGSYLNELASLKLDSVNISLDTFNPETFTRLTGKQNHNAVLSNIDGLLRRGVRVKLNAVALKGITDQQIDDFIHAAKNMPVDIRFIEFMPMGSRTPWTEDIFLPASRLQQLVAEKAGLDADPLAQSPLSGPARMYTLAGCAGRVGFISALSDHFCGACNRLRITSDGQLRTCLFSDREYRLGGLLRHKQIDDAHIARAIFAATRKKPLGVEILRARRNTSVARKSMSGIGG